MLRQAGWDEKSRVLVICPNNPFWWPVKASVAKYLARNVVGAYKDSQNRSVYFHRSGAKARAGFTQYVTAIARAVRAYSSRHRIFPVFVGMEQLDRHACEAGAQLLGGAAVFTSREYDMYQLVSILRCANLLVSSRYHGIVTSMPALVPSAGITIDGRIRNLMCQRGQQHLLVEADDEELEAKLLEVLESLGKDSESIADGIGLTVVKNVKMLASMGASLARCVHEHHPDFSFSARENWEEYLPPLSANLLRLVERYEVKAAV
jgi:polysaccharide pyruvyl transferase WcaK-like protein